MTPPRTFRPAAAVALAAGLALASGGCGKTKPTADNPPTPPAPEPGPGPGPGPGPNPNPGPGPKPPEKVDPASGVGKEAVDFLQAVRAGTAKASQLSPVFVKMVGLPAASVRHQSPPGSQVEPRKSRLGDGRHLRRLRRALRARHSEQPNSATLRLR